MAQISIRKDDSERFRKSKRNRLIIILFVLIVATVFFGAMFMFLKQVTKVQQNQPDTKATAAALPSLDIRTDGEIPWEKKIPCAVNFSQNGTVQAFSGTVKCHGGFSSRYNKHSFSLELSEKTALAGLPEDDDFILNANYIDKTFMRHKISYDIFREMNPLHNVAPASRYINVQLNGKDNGLYVLMQKITAKTAGLDKNDENAMLFKEPPVFHEKKLENPQEPDNYYQQKFPKIKHQDCHATMDSLHEFLFRSSDAAFANQISHWFDLQNVMDWHLLLLFTNNSDGLLKNFYLYRTHSGEPFRIIPWDYDHSFGRDGDGELNMLANVIDCDRCVLLRRLMENPQLGYASRLAARYRELRQQGILSVEHFREMVSLNEKEMSGGLAHNFELWPANSTDYFDGSSHQEEVDLMIQYVTLRLRQLDEQFNK